MSRKEKLIARMRANPVGVRFDDACKVARWLGFEQKGGKGSHVVFVHAEGMMLNFQNRRGCIPAYQADQLIRALERFHEPEQE